MKSALEVLGIPRALVELESSAGEEGMKRLRTIAEKNFMNFSRLYHQDVTDNPVAHQFYLELSEALQDLKDPDGLDYAVGLYLDDSDRQGRIQRIAAAFQTTRDTRSFEATLGLLENVDQFKVLGIDTPTSFLLQFGASRIILDVISHDESVLNLSALDIEVLPEQTERAEYAHGLWKEMYLAGSDMKWLSHKPTSVGAVTVVGFVPASAMRYQSSDAFKLVEGRAELGEGFSAAVMTPAWAAASEAWFLPHIKPTPSSGCEVVVRNRTGYLALIGSVQERAIFFRKE